MKYFDPQRPKRDAELPLLVDLEGGSTIFGPVPLLYMHPEKDAEGNVQWHIHCHCWTSNQAYSTFTHIAGDIAEFAAAWLDSPEEVLRSRFKYDYKRPTARQKQQLTLDAAAEDVFKELGI